MTREGPVEKTDHSRKKNGDDRRRAVIGRPTRRRRATAVGGCLTQDEDARGAAAHGERPAGSVTGDARSETVHHEVPTGETQEVRFSLRKGFDEEGWLCPTPAPHDGEIGWRKGEVTEMRGVFCWVLSPTGTAATTGCTPGRRRRPQTTRTVEKWEARRTSTSARDVTAREKARCGTQWRL